MGREFSLKGKTLLVTGGAGFIGSNFIHFMFKNYPDCRIINLDKLTYAGNLENLIEIENNPRYVFIQGDIQDKKIVEELFKKAHGVVHFAAETHVDRSILDAGQFVLTDVFGSFILLEALRRSDIEFFIHVSTDEVYGSKDVGYFKEEDALNPSSPYSASKAGADRLAYAYTVTYKLPIIIVRPSNNFGPYQYPEKFIPLFITNALQGRDLPLYGDGQNVRDWLYVDDHCRALELIIRWGQGGDIYNIGANHEKKNIEVAEMILELLGKPKDLIKRVSDRLGHDRRYAVDCERLRSLGWKPKQKFEQSLEKTVQWYRDNQGWWEKIIQKSKDFKSFYAKQYKDRLI